MIDQRVSWCRSALHGVTLTLLVGANGFAWWVWRPYHEEATILSKLTEQGFEVELEAVYPDSVERVVRKMVPARHRHICRRAERLQIPETYDAQEHSRVVQDLRMLRQLQRITAGEIVLDRGLSRAIASVRRLKHLRLERCQAVDHWDFIQQCGNLVELSLRDSSVGDASLKGLSRLTNLRRLELDGTQTGSDTWETLWRLPKLEAVSLAGVPEFSFHGVDPEAAMYLQQLDLSDTALADADIDWLKNHAVGLRRLELAGTRITDQAIETLLKVDSIVDLDISSTRVTASAIGHLLEMPNLKLLICRDLDWAENDYRKLEQQPPLIVIRY